MGFNNFQTHYNFRCDYCVIPLLNLHIVSYVLKYSPFMQFLHLINIQFLKHLFIHHDFTQFYCAVMIPDTLDLQMKVDVGNSVHIYVCLPVEVTSYATPCKDHIVWVLLIIHGNCFTTAFVHSCWFLLLI